MFFKCYASLDQFISTVSIPYWRKKYYKNCFMLSNPLPKYAVWLHGGIRIEDPFSKKMSQLGVVMRAKIKKTKSQQKSFHKKFCSAVVFFCSVMFKLLYARKRFVFCNGLASGLIYWWQVSSLLCNGMRASVWITGGVLLLGFSMLICIVSVWFAAGGFLGEIRVSSMFCCSFCVARSLWMCFAFHSSAWAQKCLVVWGTKKIKE